MKSFSKQRVAAYGPPKSRQSRQIPHWCCTPDIAYRLITSGEKFLGDPTEFGKAFRKFIKSLGMNYTLHDLRHTWITKMIQIHTPEEVRRAAGHKDLTVTMKYIHHGEATKGSEVFVPNKAS